MIKKINMHFLLNLLLVQFVYCQISFVIEFKDKSVDTGQNSLNNILRAADTETMGEPKSVLQSVEEPVVGVNFIPGVCQSGYFWEDNKCNVCPCNVTAVDIKTIRFAPFDN